MFSVGFFDRFSALSRKEALLSLLMDVGALTVKTFVLKTTRNQLTFLNKLTLAQFYRMKCAGHDWRRETLKANYPINLRNLISARPLAGRRINFLVGEVFFKVYFAFNRFFKLGRNKFVLVCTFPASCCWVFAHNMSLAIETFFM